MKKIFSDSIVNTSFQAFADEIVVLHNSTNYSLKGVFENDFKIVDPESDSVIVSSNPGVHVRKDELQFNLQGDELFTIRGENYRYFEHYVDKADVVHIVLHKV